MLYNITKDIRPCIITLGCKQLPVVRCLLPMVSLPAALVPRVPTKTHPNVSYPCLQLWAELQPQ